MLPLTVVSLVPLTLCTGVKLSKEPLVFPYLNVTVVDNPLALTVPFSVAELDVTFVAALVVTVGGTLSVDEVKDISLEELGSAVMSNASKLFKITL